MTKREIINWVKGKKDESIKKLHEAKDQMIQDRENEVLSKTETTRRAKLIAEYMNKVYDLIEENLDAFKKYGYEVIDYEPYGSLIQTVHRYCDEESVCNSVFAMTRDMYVDIVKTYNKNADKSNETYDKIIGNMSGLDAKKCIEYLKILGFDTSPLEEKKEKPCTALMANVDVNFLFAK